MSKETKQLIALGILVIITGVFTWLYINGKVFALEVNKPVVIKNVEKPYNPQQTISGYKLQPTVSDAYMQWGDNPQRTAPAKVLETATEIN
jgi:hypothetical protein